MGVFSWMFADNDYNLLIGEKIILVKPDNNVLIDDYYNGYGNILNYDIYSLFATWNRLDIINIYSKNVLKIFLLYKNNKTDEVLNDFYNSSISNEKIINKSLESNIYNDALREIGIEYNFDDEHKSQIKYPIKIISLEYYNQHKNKFGQINYDKLKKSEDDPCQGCNLYSKTRGRYIGKCEICGKDVFTDNLYYDDDFICCCDDCDCIEEFDETCME